MIDIENNVYLYKIDIQKHRECARKWYEKRKELPEYKESIKKAKALYCQKNKEEILRKKREAYQQKKKKEKEEKENVSIENK